MQKKITDEMFVATSQILANASPLAQTGTGALLPPIDKIADLSKEIAFAVGKIAQDQKLALQMSDEKLLATIDKQFWQPEYRSYRRSSL
jgi:malate dehydrogenase (oxaloacetate-decarboxylating)